jgi:hypothetical protein
VNTFENVCRCRARIVCRGCDVLIAYEVRGGSAYAAVEDYAACFSFRQYPTAFVKELVVFHQRLALQKMKRLFFTSLKTT